MARSKYFPLLLLAPLATACAEGSSGTPAVAIDSSAAASDSSVVEGGSDVATGDDSAPVDTGTVSGDGSIFTEDDTSPDLPPDTGATDAPPIDAAPSCTDGIKNGGETDVDCSGSCAKCLTGRTCTIDADCATNICSGGTCKEPSCTDMLKNATETDVDCGGGTCPKCANTKTCTAASDCVSDICTAGKCAAPSCTDKAENGTETDVDCGGATCPKCADGKKCSAATDCVGAICGAGTCVSASCTDKLKNGTETDVDCGGTCAACASGKGCKVPLDCKSGVCTAGVCAASCTDGDKNASETDIDCGGGTCGKCANGKNCALWSDCVSSYCNNISFDCAAALETFEVGTWPWTPWTARAGAGTVATTCAHDGARGWSNGEWLYRTDVSTGASGSRLSAWTKAAATGRLYLGFGANSAGAWSLVAAPNTSALIFQRNASYAYTDLATKTFTWTAGKWYRIEVSFGAAGAVTGRVYDSDGVTVLTSLATTLAGFTSGGVAIRSFNSMCADTLER